MLVIHIVITGSAIGLKICTIATEIKNYESIIKKNKKTHYKIVLLAKSKLNSIEFLICKALIDWNINHDKLVLINNVLREYDNIKKEIKNLKT